MKVLHMFISSSMCCMIMCGIIGAHVAQDAAPNATTDAPFNWSVLGDATITLVVTRKEFETEATVGWLLRDRTKIAAIIQSIGELWEDIPVPERRAILRPASYTRWFEITCTFENRTKVSFFLPESAFRNPRHWEDFQALLGPRTDPTREESRTFRSLIIIGGSLMRYHLDNDTYPANLEDLVPYYISPDIPNDAWGSPFKYDHLDDGVRVYSFGQNQVDDDGEGDDIGMRLPLSEDSYFRPWGFPPGR